MKLIAWLKDLSNDDVDIAGGKGASLGEMWNAKLPVPPAFVVTADAYKYFIRETKLNEKIKEILNGLDVNNNDELTKKSAEVRKLIENAKMPKDLELAIIESYNQLGEDTKTEEPFVAVRSSATAEDLPDASFAGQQDTYLNIKGADNVVKAVQRCFASLFTPRAVFYREQKGFDHFDVALAAVVQKMVNADKAGVLFTVNPINQNYDEMVIEGAWGLGEGVVSGTVSPDTYIVSKNGEIKDVYVATKETMFIKDEDGITKEIATPEDLKNKRVLSDEELLKLLEKGLTIEKHYNRPMDVEWAIENDEVYMLQARPITTLDNNKSKSKNNTSSDSGNGNIILKGIGASPGIESGVVKILEKIEEIDKINEGDILVTKMTTPDMVPAMKKASAIVTNDGGLTCIEGDAKILTDKGFITMREAYELVKKGEKIKILGLNSKTLKTEWKEVIDAQVRSSTRYEVGVYRKNRNTDDTIKITPDHKFPIFKDGILQKIPLEDIIKNNYSALSIDYIPIIEEKYEILADVMYLSGAILSDGHIVRKKDGRPFRVRFTQKNTEEKQEFISKVLEDIKYIGGEFRPFSNIRNDVVEYQTSKIQPSKILGFVEDNIHTIPIYATEDELTDLLAGFIDGDGCLSGRARMEIYENIEHIRKIEGIILSLYRIGAIPRMRVKKGTKTAVISFKNNIEKILLKTKRISIEKLDKLKTTVKEDDKLIDVAQMLPKCKEYDYKGTLYCYYKNKTFIGVDKLYKYLKNSKKTEELNSILEKIDLIRNSNIFSIRLIKVNEDYGEVYNLTVDSDNEFDHNYIVWTKKYTPIVVFNCHAAIISRELGTPCVVGTKKATEVLKEGDTITVDGEKGIIYEGTIKKEESTTDTLNQQNIVYQGAPLITATEIKVNVSMPEVAERAAATGADGVGLLRAEHMILGTGVHPLKVLEEEGEEALVNVFADGIRVVADAFYPKSVTYRTLDAPTDEFRGLEGGDNEPMEHNPMLGWRGIRRGLDQPEILKCELLAVKKLIEEGYKNIMVMIPLVTTADEVKKVKKLGDEIGLRLGKDVEFGVMVETPAAALIIEDIIDVGIDFVSLGTNDLTQYTIAIDRNNEFVAKYYRENHPAVLKLIEYVLKTCKKKGVKTSICGQAGSRPAIVEKLVEWGITSISSNIDAIDTIRQTVARTEQRIILDIIRDSKNRSGL